MKTLVIITFLLLLLPGCSSVQNEFTAEEMFTLVSDASNGIKSANDSLNGIFSGYSDAIHKIHIDTLTVAGTRFYGIAAQYVNPALNRFGLYDENLNLLLLDKSINGELQLTSAEKDNYAYFRLNENFLTNDSVQLSRTSIYSGDSSGFNLVFRTFTSMRTRDLLFVQNIYQINGEIIRTRISAPVFTGLNNLTDDYFYDKGKRTFDIRRSIYFDEFVTDFVNSISDTINKFALQISSGENTISKVFEETSTEAPEYYLSLNEDWKELRNKSGGGSLKQGLTGSKFVNEKLGSDIFVFKLPFYDKAESYVSVKLKNSVTGNYEVRYSDEFISEQYIKKYFEYSCRTKKFLMILSAAKDTFPEHREEYFEIINSFYINC